MIDVFPATLTPVYKLSLRLSTVVLRQNGASITSCISAPQAGNHEFWSPPYLYLAPKIFIFIARLAVAQRCLTHTNDTTPRIAPCT